MGADYYAKAAIGVMLPWERLHRRERVRQCEHDLLVSGAQFCAVCGKPAWAEEDVPVAGYDPDKGVLLGFKVYDGTDGEFSVVAVVGARANEDKAMAKLPDDLPAEKARLRAALEPLGLWDEAAWGLWAVLHCSY